MACVCIVYLLQIKRNTVTRACGHMCESTTESHHNAKVVYLRHTARLFERKTNQGSMARAVTRVRIVDGL